MPVCALPNRMDSYYLSDFSKISAGVMKLFPLQTYHNRPHWNTLINKNQLPCNLSEVSFEVPRHPADNHLVENRYLQESKDMTAARSPLAIEHFGWQIISYSIFGSLTRWVRTKCLYLGPLMRGWPGYTTRHCVLLSPHSAALSATVEVFQPTSTREVIINVPFEIELSCIKPHV
jgi:hypothetical protein